MLQWKEKKNPLQIGLGTPQAQLSLNGWPVLGSILLVQQRIMDLEIHCLRFWPSPPGKNHSLSRFSSSNPLLLHFKFIVPQH